MSGRGVVAVTTPGGFLGVAHDQGCEPWRLGNALLLELIEREGDLLGLATELVLTAPGGWQSYPRRLRRELDLEGHEPELYDADELRGQAWVSWLVMLDPVQRRITVYPGNPWLRPDTRLPPLARVQVDMDGRGRPPVFAQPPPPWPGLPVAEGWDQDVPEVRRVRERLDRALSGPDDGAALRDTLGRLLVGVLDRVDWRDPEPLESPEEKALRERLDHPRGDPRRRSVQPEDPLCVPFNWDNADRYWQVTFHDRTLRYPPATVRSPDEPLRLYRLDGTHAVVRGLEDQLRAQAAVGDGGGSALQRLGRSMRFWRSGDEEGLAAVDALIDSLVFSRGSTSGLAWWLLDWLRMGDVPLPEDRGPAPMIGSVLPQSDDPPGKVS